MQYSGAQNVPGKIEVPNLPPSAIEENGEEPEVQGEEPEVQGEEPEVQGEPTVNDDDEPIVQGEDETEPEEQPTDTDPRKGVEGGLDIANTTQQTLPPYEIRINLYSLDINFLSGGAGSWGAGWNLAAYVQGKLYNISAVNSYQGLGASTLMGVYRGENILRSTWVSVVIPYDVIETGSVYQPLSIFTVGYQRDSDTCPQVMNAPAELPEVKRILADIDSANPYIQGAKEKIANIQHELTNQLSDGCVLGSEQTIDGKPMNQRLDTVNILLPAQNYGIRNAIDAESGKSYRIDFFENCESGSYCISYYIRCPSCPTPQIN